jgi:hypothetical protein
MLPRKQKTSWVDTRITKDFMRSMEPRESFLNLRERVFSDLMMSYKVAEVQESGNTLDELWWDIFSNCWQKNLADRC